MPTARSYRSTVDPAPIPGARRQAAPTAEALGAGLGQTLTRVGADIYADELRSQDDIAIMAADKQLGEWEVKRLYDPKAGALNRRGKDAFGLPDEIGM